MDDELEAQRSPAVTSLKKKLEENSSKMIVEMQSKAIAENKLKYSISELSQKKEAAKVVLYYFRISLDKTEVLML
jgi:hypothetical protein